MGRYPNRRYRLAVPVPPRLRTWLTGRDADPSVRLRFWTEIAGLPPSDRRVKSAHRALDRDGWAARLLSRQYPDGHWATRGSSWSDLYRPKYIVTNWAAIVLSDLGKTRADPRIARTARLLMDRWSGKDGDLSGKSGEVCVTGNAVRTLVRFGYLEHPVVRQSIDWLLDTQKSDGGWHCFPSRTGTLDGWEALAAFAEIPEEGRDERMRRSIQRGAEFYLERRLSREGTPRYEPWFRIHYPNHYYYDLLVGLRILTKLGFGRDARLRPALTWLRHKQRTDGTWSLDADHPDLDPETGGYDFPGPVFPFRLEQPGRPSRWATVEALSVLRRAGQ